MNYGDKRDHRKIDIYVDGNYKASTTWAKTCKQAIERYINAYPDVTGNITARFSEHD